MSYHKINLVVCLAALSANVLAMTSDPTQVQSLTPIPVGYPDNVTELLEGWKMSNTGTPGNISNLDLDFLGAADGVTFYQAGGEKYTPTAYYTLDGPRSSQYAEAHCRTYGGVTGGRLYDPDNLVSPPTWWDASGTHNYVYDALNNYPGLFHDVCDVSGVDTFAGYYVFNGYNQGCVWTSGYGANSPAFPDITGYLGSECRCINSDDDVAGQVFSSSSGNPPAFWHHNSGTSWTLVTLSGWPSGHDGYIVGITDRDTYGDVYLVGYDLTAGQTFIYTYSSGSIRRLDAQYGPPTQISRLPFDPDDPIVSFSGNSNITGLPYIWVGSPDPASVLTGAADDMWAFLDPDMFKNRQDPSLVMTGVNSNFLFGGTVGAYPTGRQGWITTGSSSWGLVDYRQVTYSVTTGSLSTGSTFDDLRTANGRFAKFQNAYTITPVPQIVIEADWQIPGSYPNNVAFRVTDYLGVNTSSTYTVDLWDNTGAGHWHNFATKSPMPGYWQTQTPQFNVTTDPEYISSGGVVKARITIFVTGSTITPTWNAFVDQMVFLDD